MANLVNRFPEGLLAFLDLKSRGNVPSQVTETVQPVLDMGPHWELGGDPRTVLVLQNAPVGSTAYGNFGPPTGEFWLVRSAYALIRPGALGITSVPAIRLTRAASLAVHLLAGAQWPTGFSEATSQELLATWQPTWPLWLRPGDLIAGDVTATIAAPGSLTVGLHYTPFRA
jgi:hypothetical protein